MRQAAGARPRRALLGGQGAKGGFKLRGSVWEVRENSMLSGGEQVRGKREGCPGAETK